MGRDGGGRPGVSEYKPPVLAKVYEALGAVLDGRVRLLTQDSAEVRSSGGDKAYKVTWSEGWIRSNDPSSTFHSTVGYPIIAVLLANGVLPYDAATAGPLKGVPWKALNERFRRDYAAAVEHVLSGIEDPAPLRRMAEAIHADLAKLHLKRSG